MVGSDEIERDGELLIVLSHELRNPLGAISAAIALMERTDDPKVWTKGLDIIKRQVGQIRHVTDDLLVVLPSTRDFIRLHSERLDVTTVMKQAIDAVAPVIRKHGHQLNVRIPHESPIIVGDFGQLVQVMTNLLHNSAKYTQDHGVIEVEVSTEGETVTLSVCDNGPGIPEDIQDCLFQPFTQSACTRSKAQGGLGIGLALVKRIVELHQGRITVENNAPCGVRFAIHLPRLVRSQG